MCVFFLKLESNSGSYDMMDDGLSGDPVIAVLFDYHTERVKWHSNQGATEGSFSFTAAGKFHLCFGNGSGGYKTPADKERDMKRMQGHPVEDDDFNYSNVDGQTRTIGFNVRVNHAINPIAMINSRCPDFGIAFPSYRGHPITIGDEKHLHHRDSVKNPVIYN